MTETEFRMLPFWQKEIDKKRERLTHLKEMALSVSAVNTETDKVQTSASNVSMAAADRAMDLELEIRAEEESLAKVKREAEQLICSSNLDDVEKEVLHYRYVQGFTWREVESLVCYSKSRVMAIYKPAIQVLFQKTGHRRTPQDIARP